MKGHIPAKTPETLSTIRYARANSAFFKVLHKRVHDYFRNKGIDRTGGRRMYGKTFFLSVLLMLVYGLMLSNEYSGIRLILLQVAFHFVIFLISVGIAHDASHGAYFKSKKANQLLSRVFDLIGINSYLWEFNHVKSHHNAPNIPDYDSAIDSFYLFRFHPKAPWYWFHKYQHLYIVFIYALATLFKLFFLDFFSWRRKRIGFIKIQNHPPKELALLIITKLIVILYTLIIPLLYIAAPAWQVVLGFLIGNFISGIALGAIFQVTHLSDRTVYPEPDAQGHIQNSFDQHILDTTADFCPNNWLITWISGGLNLHVAHHLFPDISQTHLIAITKILQETAREHKVNYKAYSSVGGAIRSHLRTLKQLGNPDYAPNPALVNS